MCMYHCEYSTLFGIVFGEHSILFATAVFFFCFVLWYLLRNIFWGELILWCGINKSPDSFGQKCTNICRTSMKEVACFMQSKFIEIKWQGTHIQYYFEAICDWILDINTPLFEICLTSLLALFWNFPLLTCNFPMVFF